MRKRYLITCEGVIGTEIVQGEEQTGMPSADFVLDEEAHTAKLLRWSRNTTYAYVPEEVDGYPVTAVEALAFAAFHLLQDVWETFSSESGLSFSVFCILNGGRMSREEQDDGGPIEVRIPNSVTELGQYAFWHCDRLEKVVLSDRILILREGTFGECARLCDLHLPDQLVKIGKFSGTSQAMPDLGAFAGCHALKELTLPAGVVSIGAETFNSCGLEVLTVEDDPGDGSREEWSRKIKVHPSAFGHAAALIWMQRRVGGEIVWQIGLPAARDKILSCDVNFAVIAELPQFFFEQTPGEIDKLSKEHFRLDFSGRMAIARLKYSRFLSDDMRDWYREILISYFDRLDQFWPTGERQEEEAFELIRDSEGFDAEMLGRLMSIAGKAHVNTELIYKMMEYRNQEFSGITGLESLAL